METKDKRVKREIANSNERRRMQSINAGFQKLKRLLPVNDGEKLSKAAILQQAAEFIQQIEREKLIINEQNTLLRGILMEVKGGTDISTALETIDLDALPTIPINTHLAINNNSTSSNDNTGDLSGNKIGDNTGDNIVSNTATRTGNNTAFNTANSTINNSNDDCLGSAKCEIISDRVASPSTGIAKAAIALPLEVPYTATARVDQHHHELHQDPQDPAPKGQNLDTICKAILFLESK